MVLSLILLMMLLPLLLLMMVILEGALAPVFSCTTHVLLLFLALHDSPMFPSAKMDRVFDLDFMQPRQLTLCYRSISMYLEPFTYPCNPEMSWQAP